MTQEKDRKLSKKEREHLENESANEKLASLVSRAIEMETETPNGLFILNFDSDGLKRSALVAVDDNDVYSEEILFWPEIEDGILGESVLSITDFHEGANGSYEPLIFRETGKYTVESVPTFDSGGQVNKEAKDIVSHLKMDGWYKGFINEIEAARLIDGIDLSSFKQV